MSLVSLEDYDVRRVVKSLPLDVHRLLKDAGREIFLGGGYIRAVLCGETPNDVDIFGYASSALQDYAVQLAVKRRNNIAITSNTYTVGLDSNLPVQFVYAYSFSDPETMLRSFDYTITQVAIWHDSEWQSLCGEHFYRDLATKNLVFANADRNGLQLLRRAIKFIQKGYHLPNTELLIIIQKLITEYGTSISNPKKLRDAVCTTDAEEEGTYNFGLICTEDLLAQAAAKNKSNSTDKKEDVVYGMEDPTP